MHKLTQLSNFSALIFDLDGLVLDTETGYITAWKKASEAMGFELTNEFCYSLLGLNSNDLKQKLLALHGADFNLKQFAQLSEKYWRDAVKQHGIRVKKGFLNLVAELNALSIAFCLASNSKLVNVLECLKLSGLEPVFSTIVTLDDVKQGKPSPDIFLFAAKALNTPILQCLILEDSKTGLQAASNAGACSVYIPSSYPLEPNTVKLATYLLNDLDELAQMIHHS